MSAPSVSLYEFSILRKHELYWQLLLLHLWAPARSAEAAGSKGDSQTIVAAQFRCLRRLLIQFAKEKQPDLPIWLYGNLEPNLTPWDFTCWDLQLSDVHKDKKMEGNDSVLTVMKSSQDATSARVGYKSSTGGTSEAGRWRDDITDRRYCWSTKRNLKYFSKHITEACTKAKKCMKKSHCIAQRGLIAKWLIRHPCKTTQKAIIFKASQSTSLCRKQSQMHRPDGRSKCQPDEQRYG